MMLKLNVVDNGLEAEGPKRKRRLPTATIVFLCCVALTLGVLYGLRATAFSRSIASSESIVVELKSFDVALNTKWSVLKGALKDDFCTLVRQTEAAAGRDYPTAFFIVAYPHDKHHRCSTRIYIQSAAAAKSQELMQSLKAVCLRGEPLPSEFTFRGLFLVSRKCMY